MFYLFLLFAFYFVPSMLTYIQASHALYHGDLYLAYELFTKAREHRTAHELAVTFLAPEAILRNDLDLLSGLFTALDPSLIDDYSVGGQVCVCNAHISNQVNIRYRNSYSSTM